MKKLILILGICGLVVSTRAAGIVSGTISANPTGGGGGTNGSGTTVIINGNTNVVQVIQTNFVQNTVYSNGYGAAIFASSSFTNQTAANTVYGFNLIYGPDSAHLTNICTGVYAQGSGAATVITNIASFVSAIINTGYSYCFTNILGSGGTQLVPNSGQIVVLAAGSSVTVNNNGSVTNVSGGSYSNVTLTGNSTIPNSTLSTNALISVGSSNGVYVALNGATFSTFYGGNLSGAIAAMNDASVLTLQGSWLFNTPLVGTPGTTVNWADAGGSIIGTAGCSVLTGNQIYTGQIITCGLTINTTDGYMQNIYVYDLTSSIAYGFQINKFYGSHSGMTLNHCVAEIGQAAHDFYIGGGENYLQDCLGIGSAGNASYAFVLKGGYNSILRNCTSENCSQSLWLRSDQVGSPGTITSNNFIDGFTMLGTNGAPRIECVSTSSIIINNTISGLNDGQYRTNGEFILIQASNAPIQNLRIRNCIFNSPYVFDISQMNTDGSFGSNTILKNIIVENCSMTTNGVGLFNGTLYPTNQYTNLMSLVAVNLSIGGGTNESEVGTTPVITVP